MKYSHMIAVLTLVVGAHAHAELQAEGSNSVTNEQNIPQALLENATSGVDERGFGGGPGGGPGRGGPGPVHGGGFGPGHGGPAPIHGGGGPGYGPGHGPAPIHGGPGYGPGHGPAPIHGGPGFGHGGPGWYAGGPRPGWHDGWTWDFDRHPSWWHAGWDFPVFAFDPAVPYGWWQCTAFDPDTTPYSAAAPSQEEAAYNALYDCGGPDYADECYIPQGYCQFE